MPNIENLTIIQWFTGKVDRRGNAHTSKSHYVLSKTDEYTLCGIFLSNPAFFLHPDSLQISCLKCVKKSNRKE